MGDAEVKDRIMRANLRTEYNQRATKITKEYIAAILKAAKEVMDSVSLDYSGYGDSGGIEAADIVFKEEEDAPFPAQLHKDYTKRMDDLREEAEIEGVDYLYAPELPKDWDSVLCDYGQEFLEKHCPGWEINEGSSGVIHLDLQSGRVTADHRQLVPYDITYTDNLPE